MTRIVLDAMGSDQYPVPDVIGAVMAAREYGVEVILVGDEAKIIEPGIQRIPRVDWLGKSLRSPGCKKDVQSAKSGHAVRCVPQISFLVHERKDLISWRIDPGTQVFRFPP